MVNITLKELKKRISEKHKGKIFSEDHKRKISENHVGMKGKNHSIETKEKMKKNHVGMKGCRHTERSKRKIGENSKKYWAKFSKKERKNKMAKFIRAGLTISSSSLEKIIMKELDLLNIKYLRQVKICGRHVDIYIPNKKLIIECNGEFFHLQQNKIKNDKEFEKRVKNTNYKLMWLWGKDIVKNSKNALIRGFKDVYSAN